MTKVPAENISDLLFQGNYRAVLQRTIDGRRPSLRRDDIPYIVGALTFLGRVQEAEALYLDRKRSLSAADSTRTRFFLGIGFCRQSKYEKARCYLATNLKATRRSRLSPECQFYAFQGLGFYRYYCGRFEGALRASEHALKFASRSDFLYGKVLASDLYGHCLVQTGKGLEGIQALKQAEDFTTLLGDGSVAQAIQISLHIYQAQFGIKPESTLSRLKLALRKLAPQDTYSRANLLLELAQQSLLRGKIDEALSALEEAGQLIYSNKNSRQEALLNLRYSYLHFLTGEFSQALTFIRAARRTLDLAVDRSLELKILGMELKLVQTLGIKGAVPALESQVLKLSRYTGSGLNQRILARSGLADRPTPRKGLDPLGDLLDRTHANPHDSLDAILEQGYFSLLYPALSIPHSENLLYLDLSPGSLTLFHRGRVTHALGLTPLLRRIIQHLAHGRFISKSELIEQIWNHRYHPLRHDPIVYSAMTSLRKLLGPQGHWLESSESGYRLNPSLKVHLDHSLDPTIPNAQYDSHRKIDQPVTGTLDLNFRQIKAMRYLVRNEYLDVRSYKKLFSVSAITASRDLSGLASRKLVLRVGKGRAVRYILPEALLKS